MKEFSNRVFLSLYNNLYLKIDAQNRYALFLIKDNFSFYVPGYVFMNSYKAGNWDGRIHLFNSKNRTLPYGLLFDLIKLLKDNNYEVKASDQVKSMFGQDLEGIDIDYNLDLYPRDYQKNIIEECIRRKKGIFVSATGSGKSLIITYTIKTLHENNLINTSLIIVPTTNLVLQFYQDMIDYGIEKEKIGKFYAEEKDWNKPILISTWQSLSYNSEKLRKNEVTRITKELKKKSLKENEKQELMERYNTITSSEYKNRVRELTNYRTKLLKNIDCVIIDECQTVKSQEVSNLMKTITNAEFRYGCTGTMPDIDLDVANIKSFIGPIIKNYSVNDLTKKGWLNKCEIDVYNLYYSSYMYGTLNKVKDKVFSNEFRMRVIKDIIQYMNRNILILVGRIEKEGEILEKRLMEEFPNHKVKFICGRVKSEEREKWRQTCRDEDNVILISVYQIYQQGIDIPNLSCIMLGSSFKGKVRILQSIGRSLRKMQNKGTSYIIDLVDHSNKYLNKHSEQRRSFYTNEGFEVVEYSYHENEY